MQMYHSLLKEQGQAIMLHEYLSKNWKMMNPMMAHDSEKNIMSSGWMDQSLVNLLEIKPECAVNYRRQLLRTANPRQPMVAKLMCYQDTSPDDLEFETFSDVGFDLFVSIERDFEDQLVSLLLASRSGYWNEFEDSKVDEMRGKSPYSVNRSQFDNAASFLKRARENFDLALEKYNHMIEIKFQYNGLREHFLQIYGMANTSTKKMNSEGKYSLFEEPERIQNWVQDELSNHKK